MFKVNYKFQVPDKSKKLCALGPFTQQEIELQQFLQLVEQKSSNIKKPQPGEWLDSNPSEGQTFKIYKSRLKMCEGNSLTPNKFVIYLNILDEVSDNEFNEKLRVYCEQFFQTQVKILYNKKDIQKQKNIKKRQGLQYEQYCALDIFNQIDKLLPKDGFCIVGITFQDLYIDDENNYVFGVADPRARKGAFSFCRFVEEQDEQLLLYRACKVLCHEISHLFGIKHCAYYNCIMQGSNDLDEADQRPINMCAVCLRKLQHGSNYQLNLKKRNQDLLNICKQYQFQQDSIFYQNVQNEIK